MVIKNILFICRHNVFRSQIAKHFFNKLNKNKNYTAQSAGIIKCEKENLIGNEGYEIEKKLAKKFFGIKMGTNSNGLTYNLLQKTDLLIIVANDIPPVMFKDEVSFKGKIKVWKIEDVKERNADKKKVALNAMKQIKKKVEELVEELK